MSPGTHHHSHRKAPPGPTLDVVPELNGEWHAKEVESGVKDPTRAVIRFTSPPGCASSRTTGLSFVSVGIPIGNDLNGIQSEPDVRIVTVRSVSFAIVQDRRGARFALKGRDAMVNFAERLWWARQQNQVLLPEDMAEPASSEEAYAIQAQIVRLSGYEVRGFKVGSTSKQAQRLLGTCEPGSGPILAPYLHMTPARLAIVPRQTPAVEGEFAFRLGSALPPRRAAHTKADAAMAIDAIAGAIEIVGTRLAGGLAGKGRNFVTADGGANIALITGRWTADWRGLDLKAQRAAIHINGQIRGRGDGTRALGDPMNVMVWIANQQSRLGRGLKAGDIVSTGTCTGLDDVKPGDAVLADFGALGCVELQLE